MHVAAQSPYCVVMPEPWSEQVGLLIALAVLSSLTVWALVWSGLLSRRALADAPMRRVGLEPIDVAVALVLPVMAVLGAVMLLTSQREPPPAEPATVDWAMLRNLWIGQAFTQLPFVVWLLVRASRVDQGWRRMGLAPRRIGPEAVASGLGLAVAIVLVMAVNAVGVTLQLALGGEAPRIAHPLLESIAAGPSPLLLAGLFASALVAAPIFEEIIFRGLLQTALLELLGWEHRWRVVLCAAAAFAAVHVTLVPWYVMPGLFVLGVILGWLYERTGSLWPCFVVHAGFNTFNVIVAMWPTT
jgi:membrane protease YdiL (CAAX protease family)